MACEGTLRTHNKRHSIVMSTLPEELQTCLIFTSLGSSDVSAAYPPHGGELSKPRAFRGAHGSAGWSHTVKFKYAYLTKTARTQMLFD